MLTTFLSTLLTDQALTGRPHRDNLPTAPRNWRDMLRHPYSQLFLEGASLEFKTLDDKGTFQAVDDNVVNQSNITPLPLIWVFSYKFDEHDRLIKAKARLCVRGDLQHTDLDTYAATLAIRIFRALMAIAAVFNLEIRQYDAVNAFMNSTLDEITYCYKPEGFNQHPGKYYLLRRALYGLKRSPLLWANDFAASLVRLGLEPLPEFSCLFTNDKIIVFYFVDDIAVLGFESNMSHMLAFERELCKTYEMRILGELKWFLGIRVIRDRNRCKIWLCQDSYIRKIFKRFGKKLDGKHPKTPLPSERLVPNDPEAELDVELRRDFQEATDSINYAAVITRPDIAKAVSNLARFMANPTKKHLEAAYHCIDYLAGTPYYAIEYGGDMENAFAMSSDAAFGDHGDRSSSQAFVVSLFGGAIDWRATKQSTVTTSSTEAELLAMSSAGKELIAWNRFFKQIKFDPEQHHSISGDNLQTIRLLKAQTPKLVTKLRHVDIHQSWLRQEVQAGNIDVHWIPTGDMPADGLTKILSRQQHEKFVALLRLVDVGMLVND